MKIQIFIFSSIFFCTIAAQSAKDKGLTILFRTPNQNIGLYDYFQQRLKNFKEYHEAEDSVHKDKRTLNGKYIPLYDEFKKRLNNFNAAILMDKDTPSLTNKNLYNGCSDCLCAVDNKSNDNEDKMRSNRGFFKYFGFNDNDILKTMKSSKVPYKGKGKTKTKQLVHGSSESFSKTKVKGALVGIKPGTLYDEYKKQIGKIIDVHIS